ncbi:MAG: S-layer homology domain-containing protein [Deltaproteobacteria bacterium]
MNKKRSLFFCFLLISLFLMTTFFSNASSKKFKDVPSDHWANKAIQLMTDRKIIAGYDDSTFKPNNIINRAEFARMMVLALNIPIKDNPTATFKDVYSNDWFFKDVESAKFYLTGFRTPTGDYFRPLKPAAREDMAVAIVKALGMENETADENILNKFSDAASISPNLKRYVAIAIKNEIMKGANKGKALIFQPNKPLTRAEAVVLLSNVISEEKVTEEKVTYDNNSEKANTPAKNITDENIKESEADIDEEKAEELDAEENVEDEYTIPKLSGKVDGSKIILKWNKIDDKRLQGYKVVISKYNSSPKYPDNGYLYWITDRTKTYAVIDNKTAYNNGDFDGYLEEGEKYYFSITAVYSDKKVPGNVIRLIYPE